ncbi:DUF1822 family protein [Leptolyngbya sp. NK1-12]|uniref:DUF1822 family protein n=1 Tax=Leptolyngbya sp. NK1-12 TaxID=2547451 RepID=A0AA96WHJ3_9CYAN|nr:DUF1822 family protein [Leptolyngbya sp. NK1-12]
MTDDSIHTAEFDLFQALPMQTVPIEPEQIEQAIVASDRVVTESRQWKTYLNALALYGFQQWLNQQANELSIDHQQSSIWQPVYANVIEAVCNVRVGHFKLCLVTTRELEATIQLPRAVMDLPEFTAHFYVAVRILEEQEQAQIWGYLRYDQWIQYQRTQPLMASPSWTYAIPLDWFDRDLTRLLLHLRCLEPTAVPLSEPPPRLEQITDEKDTIMRQLAQHPTETLWQRLTWEQGVVVLTNPALLEWYYQLQTNSLASSADTLVHSPASQPNLPQSLIQSTVDMAVNTAVNVGSWLQNELDDIAQQLHWVLLPPFAAVRSNEYAAVLFPMVDASTMQEIDLICKQLARDGVKIPAGARCAYNNFNLAEIPLRLYAVTWSEAEEWTLLLILKLQSAHQPERAIKLCVNDQNEVLVEAILDPKSGNNSLYTRVVGEKDEQFQVILALENAMLTLPPFRFHLSESAGN